MRSLFLLALVTAVPASAQQTVHVRDLTPAQVRSAESFGAIFGVRQLEGGNVLVNDGGRRELRVLDPTFANSTVVMDSSKYGPRAAPLIPYLADSTLFVDVASQSLLVIDPKGAIARVTAAPRPQDLRFLTESGSGVDDKGRLVYRAPIRMTAPARGAAPGQPVTPQVPDSAAIVRADFDTRGVDTLGRVKSAVGTRASMTTGPNGQMSVKMTINPVQVVDEWAVLSDGSVAFVRGHDYHIDWLNADGSRTSTPKLPFDWRRLTDDDKQKLIDSARTAQETAAAKAAEAAKNSPQAGVEAAARAAAVAGAAGGQHIMISRGAVDGAAPMAMSGGQHIVPVVEFVPLSEIPDYYPPIRMGATRADLDGNLWILPTTSAQSQAGELVYDVVNRKGELFERVRIPAGRSIAGFGRGGVVYLMSGTRAEGFYLERTTIIGSARVAQD